MNSILLLSSNKGNKIVDVGIGSYNVTKIVMVNGTFGFLSTNASSNDAIWFTRTGGKTWERPVINLPQGIYITDFDYYTEYEELCMVFSGNKFYNLYAPNNFYGNEYAELKHTFNNTMNVVYSPTFSSYIENIGTMSNVYFGGFENNMYRYDGSSVSAISGTITSGTNIRCISSIEVTDPMYDEAYIYASATDGKLYEYTGGSLALQAIPIASRYFVGMAGKANTAFNATRVMAITSDPSIIKSTNYNLISSSWNTAQSPDEYTFRSVLHEGGNTFYINNNIHIYKTKNFGNTWELIYEYINASDYLTKMTFYTDTSGRKFILVGSKNKVHFVRI